VYTNIDAQPSNIINTASNMALNFIFKELISIFKKTIASLAVKWI